MSVAVPVTERDRTKDPGSVPSIRHLLVAACGLLMLQLAWTISIPAFGGMDEFDHVYRASAVGHGQWRAPANDATRGTGAWVYVDPSLPLAAHPECKVLPYTTNADCIGTRHGDMTRIASGAGRYNPLFYAMVGYPTLAFSGTSAVFAMRAVAMLCCTGLILLGLIAMRRWARTRWPFVGALVALTPTLIYSTTMAAPNGLELSAGFAFWSGAIGLMSGDPERPHRFLLGATTFAAVLLVLIRPMGPLWCLLAAIVVIIATPEGFSRLRQLVRQRAVLLAAGSIAFAVAVAVGWTQLMGSLVIGEQFHEPMTLGTKLSETASRIILWALQSIAAFPYRTDVSPTIVYACYLVLGVGIVTIGWISAHRRLRLAMFTTILLAALVPATIAFATMDRFYDAWQGRYGLPFALGLFLLAGLAAERGEAKEPGWRFLGPAFVLYALATTVGIVRVLRFEHQTSPSVANGDWSVPPTWLVITLTVAGTVLLWSMVRPPRTVDG